MKTIQFQTLYHYGTLHAEDKQRNSQEGAGLSVSLHPEVWKTLAKLGSVPLHTLQKENNQFLEYYASLKDKSLEENILSWGVEKGYIAPATLYHVSYLADDIDCMLHTIYTDKEEAMAEHENCIASEFKKIQYDESDGYISLLPLQERTNSSAEPSSILPLLTTVFVEDETELDGVWWNEPLDVHAYVAPRGVIVPKRVYEWQFTQTK